MALNLSTLTSPATSGNILEEVNTTADFLESVPVFRNLSRGSNKGGDAKQDVALNQPKALPLIDGDGYLYLPRISGNQAEVNSVVLPETSDFDLRVEFVITEAPPAGTRFEFFSQYNVSGDGRLIFSITDDLRLRLFWHPHTHVTDANVVTIGQRHVARITRVSGQNTIYIDDTQLLTFGYSGNILQTNTVIGLGNTDDRRFKGAIFSVTEGSNTNIDFTSTNVRHGDTKLKCATGQVVTINQAGNDPATVIKKSVLRFDGTNDGLHGLFANNIDGGYMFAAFSVLGDGGEAFGRVFSIADNVGTDAFGGGFIFSIRDNLTDNVGSYFNSFFNTHNDLFDDSNGDILHEVKSLSGQHHSKINNANAINDSRDTSTVNSDRFNICAWSNSINNNTAIDLEFLALFPASITDAQADSVRNYINNRNNVFSLIDSQGYYFYDAQKAPAVPITTGSSSWNGRIVGSDNGDTDKLATQGTSDDQPVGDGYVVTFADNTDHLEITNPNQAGWQVVGTSIGTFAYKVNNTAVTELNLLGNLGNASYRRAGDLYGIILLPESATGREINEAKKLLTDRGASVSATASILEAWWLRSDIVQFDGDMSGVTNAHRAWRFCSSLTSFSTALPLATNVSNAWQGCSSLTSFSSELPSATTVASAWRSCSSLTDFRTTDIKNSTNFISSWHNCSALTSFPAGAKLGTEAVSNVNFSAAWMNSGLMSFPPLDLSNGTNFSNAFRGTAITQFPSDALLGTDKTDVNFNSAFRSSDIISFSTPLPTGNTFADLFKYCGDLTDVSVDVFTNWNPSTIANACFNDAWTNCASLTAQSVENILTSIDASGKYGTATGAAGGGSIDSGIDIDYNVATGSLSAATNAAVDSLKAKGWVIVVNGVTL